MRWIWIDRFVDFEPGARAVAIKNVTLAEEHLHDVGDKPFRTRRMRVKESVVDTLNASETGQVEMTLTELENSVDSILDD